MAEKLTILLTDRDIEVIPSSNGKNDIIEYSSKCPLCSEPLALTRIAGHRCSCDIAWNVDIKIKGTRSFSDEDREQPSLPLRGFTRTTTA